MLAESGKKKLSRKTVFCCFTAETKEERVILQHTSSLTIAIGSSFAVTTFILVGLLALLKRHFL